MESLVSQWWTWGQPLPKMCTTFELLPCSRIINDWIVLPVNLIQLIMMHSSPSKSM
jgi:hypothetical protein